MYQMFFFNCIIIYVSSRDLFLHIEQASVQECELL